jgi:hypothetical protein
MRWRGLSADIECGMGMIQSPNIKEYNGLKRLKWNGEKREKEKRVLL